MTKYELVNITLEMEGFNGKVDLFDTYDEAVNEMVKWQEIDRQAGINEYYDIREVEVK